MADSGPLNGNGGGFNWRIEFITTLIKQGPAWVLLTIFGIGFGYLFDKHAPSLISQVQGGFERNAASLTRDVDKMSAACERIAKTNEVVLVAMQQSLGVIEKNQKGIQSTLDELRRVRGGAAGGE